MTGHGIFLDHVIITVYARITDIAILASFIIVATLKDSK